jgi:mycothiol maleylpyruvate isomerase-like protein
VTGTRDDVEVRVGRERARLLTVLEGLDDAGWRTPSLCAGWSVRDLAVHLLMPYELSMPRFLVLLARSPVLLRPDRGPPGPDRSPLAGGGRRGPARHRAPHLPGRARCAAGGAAEPPRDPRRGRLPAARRALADRPGRRPDRAGPADRPPVPRPRPPRRAGLHRHRHHLAVPNGPPGLRSGHRPVDHARRPDGRSRRAHRRRRAVGADPAPGRRWPRPGHRPEPARGGEDGVLHQPSSRAMPTSTGTERTVLSRTTSRTSSVPRS